MNCLGFATRVVDTRISHEPPVKFLDSLVFDWLDEKKLNTDKLRIIMS